MSELKPWPDRAKYETPGDPGPHDPQCCLCVRCARFYRDKGEVLEARYRLAVEALIQLEQACANNEWITGLVISSQALAILGPLPKEQT